MKHNIRNIFLFSALFLVWSDNCLAAAATPKDNFEQINSCVRQEDADSCRHLLTVGSSPLYNRFMSYGLMNCLPKDAQYVSQQEIDGGVIVRASVTDMGRQRFMRLVFTKEGGEWKLDVTESLRMAMGKNWQQQIDLVEQLYLLMRKQFGAKLDCAAIRGLVNIKQ